MVVVSFITLKVPIFYLLFSASSAVIDVLWGQPIKLIQVASNSELREN